MKICIDIGNGHMEYITVFENDSPTNLANEFAKKHGINEKIEFLLR